MNPCVPTDLVFAPTPASWEFRLISSHFSSSRLFAGWTYI